MILSSEERNTAFLKDTLHRIRFDELYQDNNRTLLDLFSYPADYSHEVSGQALLILYTIRFLSDYDIMKRHSQIRNFDGLLFHLYRQLPQKESFIYENSLRRFWSAFSYNSIDVQCYDKNGYENNHARGAVRALSHFYLQESSYNQQSRIRNMLDHLKHCQKFCLYYHNQYLIPNDNSGYFVKGFYV